MIILLFVLENESTDEYRVFGFDTVEQAEEKAIELVNMIPGCEDVMDMNDLRDYEGGGAPAGSPYFLVNIYDIQVRNEFFAE